MYSRSRSGLNQSLDVKKTQKIRIIAADIQIGEKLPGSGERDGPERPE